jgi:hypothetical protein
MYKLSEEVNSMATKVGGNGDDNCLWATRVMESGKHQMSLKLMEGEGSSLNHYFGLVRDGAAWDEDHRAGASTDAWYMDESDSLFGHGKDYDDEAGEIDEGQIVSMEADLDKGTLRFWVDGKSLTVLVGAVV